ncbi:MAG: alpha/beta fold hydrolase [Pyrinomonadaceae bacterium]
MSKAVKIIGILGCAVVAFAALAIGFIYLAPETATRAFVDLDRWRSGLVRKEIALPDGTRYVYLEGGQGEPLMLLHGFGANKDNFARVAASLTPRYRVIIPDHIGFGESAHPPDADYSPTAQAERIHTLALALGVNAVHVGGSSMGGQIALSYAAMYPGEVKTLWLLAPAGVWSAPPSELRTTFDKTGENPLLVRNEDEFARLFELVMSDPPFVPRPLLDVFAQERIRNFTLEQRIFEQIVADSVEQRVSGLATPTLIVWGTRDRLIHVETANVLHALLPNSEVIIMNEIGHAPMLERPRQTAEDYLRFREKLSAGKR